MISSEAIQLIQKTAQDAAIAQVLDIDDPRAHHIRLGNEVIQIAKPPAIRTHKASSIEAFCQVVNNLPADSGQSQTATVWHDGFRVVGIFDDGDRRDTVKCELTPSRQLETLRKVDRTPLNQREFVRCLKLELGVPEDFVAQFRKLQWSHGENMTTEHNRGADKLGASIRAEVDGVESLPDKYMLRMPLYDTDGAKQPYDIQCLIELDADPNARTITLAPQPGAIQAALDAAQKDIEKDLNGGLKGNVPVFYGAP